MALVGLAFFVGVATWGINWIRRLTLTEMIANIVLDMRKDAFTAATTQDLSFYDEFNSGRVVSRITGDTDEFGQVVTLSIDVINQLSVAIILIVYLFTVEWRLTMILLAIAPLVVFSALGFRRLARTVTRQSSRALGEVNKSIQEAVTGIGVAKNFRQEQFIYDEFTKVNQQAYQLNVQRGFILANIFPVLNTLAGFAIAGLLYFGGRTAIAGLIGIGAWTLFMQTVDRFWFPLINAASFWSQFQQGLSAAERVFALIDSKSSVRQHDDHVITDLKGELTFENVQFRYTQQEQVLPDFSLKIRPGESVAFVGHTGAENRALSN